MTITGTALLSVFLTSVFAQTKTWVPLSREQLIIYRAGSLREHSFRWRRSSLAKQAFR